MIIVFLIVAVWWGRLHAAPVARATSSGSSWNLPAIPCARVCARSGTPSKRSPAISASGCFCSPSSSLSTACIPSSTSPPPTAPRWGWIRSAWSSPSSSRRWSPSPPPSCWACSRAGSSRQYLIIACIVAYFFITVYAIFLDKNTSSGSSPCAWACSRAPSRRCPALISPRSSPAKRRARVLRHLRYLRQGRLVHGAPSSWVR